MEATQGSFRRTAIVPSAFLRFGDGGAAVRGRCTAAGQLQRDT